MKIFKFVLITIGTLVFGFFLLGMVKSEITYDCEVVVEKPFAESWAVSQDPEKLGEWLIGYQRTENISGEPGTVGAVSDIYFVNEGQEMVIRETITEVKPGESMSMTFDSDFMKMDYTIAMEDLGGKTKILSNTTTVGNGMMSKSIMALVESSIKEQEETNLANLKKVIESNSKSY